METSQTVDVGIERIRGYLATGVSQSSLASSAGISPSVVANILAGKYPGDVEGNIAKLISAIEDLEAKSAQFMQKPGFVETSVHKRIENALSFAGTQSSMVLSAGEAGIGKTESLLRYKETHPQSILIEVDPTYNDRALLRALAEAVGVDGSGSKDVVFNRIVQKLKNTGRTVIIDEAEYLRATAFDILRRIHDKTEVSICIFGTEKLLKLISSTRDRFAQVYSRIFYFGLEGLTREDYRLILSQVMKVDEELLARFWELGRGNARRLVKLLSLSRVTARQNGRDTITPAIVSKAAQNLI